MEVHVQVQIPAFVSVGGVEGHVKKVKRAFAFMCEIYFSFILLLSFLIDYCVCSVYV